MPAPMIPVGVVAEGVAIKPGLTETVQAVEVLRHELIVRELIMALEGIPLGTPVERLNVYRMLSDWILYKGRCQNRVRF